MCLFLRQTCKKLFKLERRSRKRSFLLCLMTVFDLPHSKFFWLHAGAVVMAIPRCWSDSEEGADVPLRSKDSKQLQK